MFRRYQRVQDAPSPPKLEVDPQEKALRAKQRQEKERKSLSSAEVAEIQRDAKRQEKLLDVRMELHKRVLETLNLGALEKASEQELRREIGVITREGLEDARLPLVADRDVPRGGLVPRLRAATTVLGKELMIRAQEFF